MTVYASSAGGGAMVLFPPVKGTVTEITENAIQPSNKSN